MNDRGAAVPGVGRRRTRAPRPGAQLVGALGIGVVGTGLLVGCTSDPPPPDQAAAALASALASGDLGGVPLAPGTTAAQATDARSSTFEPLGEVPVEVAASSTVVDPADDAAATVTLDYSWDLDGAGDGDPWTYSTTAHLERDADDVWRATWEPDLLVPDLTDGETLVVTREPAPRGDVIGADGQVIVEARPVHRIGIDKTAVPAADQEAAAHGLADALDLDADDYALRVASAGDKAFVEAIVVREGDPDYDVDDLAALPGVLAVDDELPLAPTREFARPILGTVGAATAEIVEKSAGAIAAGDLAGLSGLQRQYEDQLNGTPGLTVEARSGTAVRRLHESPPVPGADLVTTLDVDAQLAAEKVLSGVGPAAAIVAIQPSTGDVLAAASGPGGDGLSTATLGQYAPGSTFKVVSTLALLRSGLAPTSIVACPTSIDVDGRTFDNFPDYPADAVGEVTLSTAFANSCNTAFIGQREAAPQDAVVDAAGSLGLLGEGATGFASFLGAVPSESDGTDHAATMIGQGRVLASPLGMAVVAASVGAGHTVTPRLVLDEGAVDGDGADGDGADGAGADGVVADGGRADGAEADGAGAGGAAEGAADSAGPGAETPSTESSGTEISGTEGSADEDSADEGGADEEAARALVPLGSDEAGVLRGLMRGVVTDGGARFLEGLPGEEILAKTGTAQFGPQEDLRNHVWMIAVQGDLAVAVFVDEGEYGSTTAGPLLEDFLASSALAGLTGR